MQRLMPHLLVVVIAFCTGTASAGEIASWVDANGLKHFGDPQFAPSGADRLELDEVNLMDAPQTASTRRTSSRNSGRASFRKIETAPKRNKYGWSGRRGSSRIATRNIATTRSLSRRKRR